VRIYDYADLNVPMLARMFDRRCRGYEVIGYTILLPASAIPGWPADVVLPSDPVWKRDYSGSVRRLIRDGVDTPLASLFMHAARPMHEDAKGAGRARSATEAFLYRRLDTLKETNGRFRLNVALPIPFDGFGTLEVDLLCADARLAIELDGGQHLADPVAYRRDRRKDQLLQENGYFVLRFLAEDVGKELDAVLDAVLRVLARHRQAAAKAEPLKFVSRAVNESSTAAASGTRRPFDERSFAERSFRRSWASGLHCQHRVQEDHDESAPDGGSSVSSRSSDSSATVVALVAEGQTTEAILTQYPDLEADDVREALLFAAEAVRERALPLAAGE